MLNAFQSAFQIHSLSCGALDMDIGQFTFELPSLVLTNARNGIFDNEEFNFEQFFAVTHSVCTNTMFSIEKCLMKTVCFFR